MNVNNIHNSFILFQQIIEDANFYSLISRLELIYLVEKLFNITPFLRKHASRFIMFPCNTATNLIVCVNQPKNKKRVSLKEKDGKSYHFLNNNTTEILR